MREEPGAALDGARAGLIDDLAVPALLVDRAAVERNAARMAGRTGELGVSLRPHVKAHKCVELARIQLGHGAIGLTTATAAEAVAMAAAGVEDIFVANQVVDPVALAALARAAASVRIAVAVDDPAQVTLLAEAAAAAASVIDVLVEVDVGMRRGGVRRVEEALPLARAIRGEPDLRFAGLCGYEGHCVDEPDRRIREREVVLATTRVNAAKAILEEAGITVGVVSVGGTGTFDLAGEQRGVTELQAGSYLLMDEYHATVTDEFEPAVAVLASVISRHGEEIVLDAGLKAVSTHLAPIRLLEHPGEVLFVNEEHSAFRVPGSDLGIGDRVRISPGYTPLTVNLYSRLWLVEGESVLESCLVRARHGDP